MTLSPYPFPTTLVEPRGNNAFAWDERQAKYGVPPTLTVPSLISGTLDDVHPGTDIVFADVENGELRSCTGLAHFVELIDAPYGTPTYIFDNHQHALMFWIHGLKQGIIDRGYTLIHIDEHSDLWDNPHTLDLDRALIDDAYVYEFTQYDCNVWNYIQPAQTSGLIGDMIRIENEYQMDAFLASPVSKNSILNLDLDIFAPELAHIPREKIINTIHHAIKHVRLTTIATSPFFIDQRRALDALRAVMDI